MNADFREGMRLFQAWFVSGEDAWSPLHEAFKGWSDHAARETVRDLYSLAHGEEPAR